MKRLMMRSAILVVLALGAIVLLALQPGRGARDASAVGNPPARTPSPLLSCFDLTANGVVRIDDVLQAVGGYFHDYPAANYVFLNDTTGDGIGRIDDVLVVVGQYFYDDCPALAVDTQVAQATLAVLALDNSAVGTCPANWNIMAENATCLGYIGYVGGSTDVSGQGTHYVKVTNWDGNFDPEVPEGLVYDSNDRLAAQLYVVNGDFVGWIEDPLSLTPGPCWDGINNASSGTGSDSLADGADPDCGSGAPVGSSDDLDDTNIDTLCAALYVPCSWDGSEGWHLHYRLCTIHIGTPYAMAIPFSDQGAGHNYQGDCNTAQNYVNCPPSDPAPCPGWGINTYSHRVGWMGHLWNHLPNANKVPDAGSTMNGRFADCYPDQSEDPWLSSDDPFNVPVKLGWTPYNCPQ